MDNKDLWKVEDYIKEFYKTSKDETILPIVMAKDLDIPLDNVIMATNRLGNIAEWKYRVFVDEESLGLFSDVEEAFAIAKEYSSSPGKVIYVEIALRDEYKEFLNNDN